MLYLGVSQTHQAQTDILEALTRKFRLDPGLDLRQLAERCPFNYTGADLYALCSDAMLNAMSRKAEALERKIGTCSAFSPCCSHLLMCLPRLAYLNALPEPHDFPDPLTPQYFLAEMASADDMDVFVSKEDFDLALDGLIPSVSQSEMEHYARIQHRFTG
jgi:peroxin-6